MEVETERNYTLKAFQLRAARVAAGIELSTIGDLIGFTRAYISFWEHKDSFYKLKISKKNILIINELFAQHNIFFPDGNSISLRANIIGKKQEGLTKFQLKAARAILHLTREELSDLLDVRGHIIRKAELSTNNRYVYMRPPLETLPMKLKSFFESKNIVFENDLTISFFKNKKSI